MMRRAGMKACLMGHTRHLALHHMESSTMCEQVNHEIKE